MWEQFISTKNIKSRSCLLLVMAIHFRHPCAVFACKLVAEPTTTSNDNLLWANYLMTVGRRDVQLGSARCLVMQGHKSNKPSDFGRMSLRQSWVEWSTYKKKKTKMQRLESNGKVCFTVHQFRAGDSGQEVACWLSEQGILFLGLGLC